MQSHIPATMDQVSVCVCVCFGVGVWGLGLVASVSFASLIIYSCYCPTFDPLASLQQMGCQLL